MSEIIYQTPWRSTEYSGKLISTVSLNKNNYPQPSIDDLIGTTLELLIEGQIEEEQATRMLTRYDKLKKEGHWILPK